GAGQEWQRHAAQHRGTMRRAGEAGAMGRRGVQDGRCVSDRLGGRGRRGIGDDQGLGPRVRRRPMWFSFGLIIFATAVACGWWYRDSWAALLETERARLESAAAEIAALVSERLSEMRLRL